jgi:SAM-dependent methyltransferase
MLARDFVNYFLSKKKTKKYLEIGLYHGMTFNYVDADIKHSVDPDENLLPTFKMTSDSFFRNVAPVINVKYDVIFIDGLHHMEQVDKDIENSFKFLEDDGIIVLHDCNPINEMRQRVPADFDIWVHGWNGDVWKSIAKFRKNNSHLKTDVFVINIDEGIGVIKNNVEGVELILELPDKLDYEFLDKHRTEILNLKSVEEFHKYEIDSFIKDYLKYWKL